MGFDQKIPLPAPTDSDIAQTVSLPPDDDSSVISDPSDEVSHYSLPDDGTPVTIKTRGHRPNKSQTSLLIEYFEGGKSAVDSAGSGSRERRPSVRVRVTPSRSRSAHDHIQITEMSSRKASHHRAESDSVVSEDARSLHSYASATEESNVSRNPIEVEIDAGHRRRRKPSSPLIPAADSKLSYVPPNMSDISNIPTDSFLDGTGPTTSFRKEENERAAAAKNEARAAAALNTASTILTDKSSNRGSRSETRDRGAMQKAIDRAGKPDRKSKPRARSTVASEKDLDRLSSPRRKSRSTNRESLMSGIDSSVMSSQLTASQLTASQLTGSQRSYDSYSSSKISINNPKLLETVEDAIRRLILPELDAIKRERSQRDNSRRPKDRDSFSSLASASKEEISVASKRKSADTSHSTKSKTSRGREARNDLSPQSSADDMSVEDNGRDAKTPKQNDRGKDNLTAAAIGAVAALQSPSRGDNKRERRRRRAEPSKRDSYTDEYGDVQHEVMPPMPLSSELNPSEMTRASIQSTDSHRPHSASDEMTSVQEVNRGVASVEAAEDVPAPAVTASQTLQPLGGLQAKISKGDLRNLPRRGTMEPEDFEEEEFRSERARDQDNYYDDYDDEGRLAEAGTYDDEEDRLQQAYYGHQDVPAPLRYVPYQQERRGLSPIQSVSGFTEGGDSEVAGHRDSRIAPTDSELSASPGKSRGVWSPTSVPSNMRSREFNDEASSVLSSGVGYRQSTYTEDSELDGPAGRAVHVVGSNPQMIHHDSGPESAVASLVDGSHFDPSLLSGTGGQTQDYRNSQYSYDDGFTRDRSAQGSPLKQSVKAEHIARQQSVSPVSTAGDEPSTVSQNFVEYDLDEYGRKVPQAQYRHSPTASEAAITSAALRQATAEALKRKNVAQESSDLQDEEFVGEGVSRNKSFKERARGNFELATTPKHSTDRLSEYDQPNLGATGLPDMGNPMPEIGYGYDDGQHSRQQTPSIVEGMPGDRYAEDDHEGAWTPTREASYNQYDRSQTPKASESGFFGATDAAAAATIATATALAASHHKRQDSQDQDEEWQRTSGDRKRDTLVTNPYEGASPIANLPGLDGLQGGYGANAYPDFNTGSPGLPAGDEGYISSAPNDLRNNNNNNNNVKGKGVDFAEQSRAGPSEDPFYSTPKGQRQMSGMSQGVGSPLYDASTGNGIDSIQSKDIIALMEHLMVRDAQRSARDTEMLVTLVQSAAEMRNSFEDIKRMLADTEDQIITEIKDNTEQTVKRHLGGPRPFPGSSPRSIQEDSQAGAMDEVAKKKRSFLRRALQGLGSKGANDLGRIEDMLMQLLTDVDVLKHQTAGPSDASPGAQSMRSVEGQEPEDQYDEQGYEPEGRAGTSTASYASQSGALSTGKNSGRLGHDRKISDNRISTVPEGNEDEYDDTYVTAANQYSPQQRGYLSPAPQLTRGGSVPLNTPPPQSSQHVPNSFSNENTPRTDDGKKHKSRGSATFFPKISRWSETTTSSLGKVFRSNNTKKNSGEAPEDFLQHPASRSGSVDEYDTRYQYDSYGQDKLHSGFSEHDLSANVGASGALEQPQSSFGGHGPPPASYATPEDPKYKAHRNSLNLMHPQPRPGQSFRTALESSAQVYDGPMSPNSADWAGSATSLNRFPEQNTNRYSDNSALTGQGGDSYHWQQSPAPPRPPKEPLEGSPLAQMHSPHQSSRLSHMQRTSPMPYASAVDSGYGTGSATHAGSYHSGSPKPENKNLSTALGVPTRRPSGPRAMTPTRSLDDGESERRRKRDTFGSVARPGSAASHETDTF
ncbi:Dim2-associated protein 1 [Microdochium nivale]|nr:Dim2-associated protein 1 [Microdochium nivale]